MTKFINRLACFITAKVFFASLFLSFTAGADVRIDITRGVVSPIPLAITEFHGSTETERQIGTDIANVISSDLESSGLFKPLDRQAFIQQPKTLNVRIEFNDWRIINAQALVSGNVKRQEDGRLRVEFRLWDVVAEEQMTGLAYFTKADNWRRVSHIIADVQYINALRVKLVFSIPGLFTLRRVVHKRAV